MSKMRLEIFKCDKCEKGFYTASHEAPDFCPWCGCKNDVTEEYQWGPVVNVAETEIEEVGKDPWKLWLYREITDGRVPDDDR